MEFLILLKIHLAEYVYPINRGCKFKSLKYDQRTKCKNLKKPIFQVNADVDLMVENVIQNKNRIITCANVSVKKQQNITYAKNIMPGILAYLLVTEIGIVTLANIPKYPKKTAHA